MWDANKWSSPEEFVIRLLISFALHCRTFDTSRLKPPQQIVTSLDLTPSGSGLAVFPSPLLNSTSAHCSQNPALSPSWGPVTRWSTAYRHVKAQGACGFLTVTHESSILQMRGEDACVWHNTLNNQDDANAICPGVCEETFPVMVWNNQWNIPLYAPAKCTSFWWGKVTARNFEVQYDVYLQYVPEGIVPNT